MCAINCPVYLEWGRGSCIYFHLFPNSRHKYPASSERPLRTGGATQLPCLKTEPRNSGQKITLSPCPCGPFPRNHFLPQTYVEQYYL
jgi:hypothetical protein